MVDNLQNECLIFPVTLVYSKIYKYLKIIALGKSGKAYTFHNFFDFTKILRNYENLSEKNTG